MPDRRPRATLRLPLPTASVTPDAFGLRTTPVLSSGVGALAAGTVPGPGAPLLLREQPSSSPSSSSPSSSSSSSSSGPSPSSTPDAGGDGAGDGGSGAGAGGRGSADADNPFAPPPEGSPDKPWQPRRPADDDSGGQGGSAWNKHWSDQQPGRSSGGFGDRPGQGGQDGGPNAPQPGPRWDPTDPGQRRARYALLSGMWSFFFALFSWPYMALLLGALALYWGISSLRMKSRPADPTAPAETRKESPGGDIGARQQKTAAVSGLVTAGLGLAMVAAMFTAQMVYSDYYTCVNDALTTQSENACEDLLPKDLRPLLGDREE